MTTNPNQVNNNLDGWSLAAALCEESYRRNDKNFGVTFKALNVTPIDVTNELNDVSNSAALQVKYITDPNGDNGHYYDMATGFSASVVEKGDKIYVTFRGTDSNYGAWDAVIKTAFNSASAEQSDSGDSYSNPTLAQNKLSKSMNAGEANQFQDAIKLVRAVQDYAEKAGKQITLAGQSLGGGIAGLTAKAMKLPAYIISPAPQLSPHFSNDAKSIGK